MIHWDPTLGVRCGARWSPSCWVWWLCLLQSHSFSEREIQLFSVHRWVDSGSGRAGDLCLAVPFESKSCPRKELKLLKNSFLEAMRKDILACVKWSQKAAHLARIKSQGVGCLAHWVSWSGPCMSQSLSWVSCIYWLGYFFFKWWFLRDPEILNSFGWHRVCWAHKAC